MKRIVVRLRKRVFVSPESGFAVFSVQSEDASAPAAIKGALAALHEGDRIEAEGKEEVHPRFGRQLLVESYKLLLPTDAEGAVRYLGSGRIKGLGKKTAQRIVDHLGPSALALIEQDAAVLEKVPGLRKAVVAEARRAFLESRVIRDLAVRLSPYGVGLEIVHKIHHEFGDAAGDVVAQNPYLLIGRVRGVSFKTADRIGRALGLAGDDLHRLQAGILYVLEQAEAQSGHLYLPRTELLARCQGLLAVPGPEIAGQLAELAAGRRLVVEEAADIPVALPQNDFYERSAAGRLFELARPAPPPREVTVHFQRVFSRLQVELTEEQRAAVTAAVQEPLVVISGGPGTGKTTIIRALIDVFCDNRLSVLVAAPTGRAAKRIEESCGCPASTIHRLLKINPATGRFGHDRGNPLPADVVIVDEFSMVDAFLLHSLLQALPDGSRLVVIGDRDQLPPVGPGNALRDIIASGRFPVILLTRNFRQAQGSLIVENACRVICGRRPLIQPYADDLDFVLVPVAGPEQALEKVEGIFRHYRDRYPPNSPDLQVLAPMYRGGAGIDAINRLVQERWNEGRLLCSLGGARFKQGDKIMQLRNDYEKEVSNGDLGVVSGFDPGRQALLADYDGLAVEYAAGELDDVTLAYAVSVHKSQGSEYDVVAIVLLPESAGMLTRELLYTAITRARRRLILISDEETVWRAVQNTRPQLRRTLLPRRLRECFAEKM